MSALTVQNDSAEQLVGLTVRCARKLIHKDWGGKLKKNLRSMIRSYSQEMRYGANHWSAISKAKGRMKCPVAKAEFTEIMRQARVNAQARAQHPTRMLLPLG